MAPHHKRSRTHWEETISILNFVNLKLIKLFTIIIIIIFLSVFLIKNQRFFNVECNFIFSVSRGIPKKINYIVSLYPLFMEDDLLSPRSKQCCQPTHCSMIGLKSFVTQPRIEIEGYYCLIWPIKPALWNCMQKCNTVVLWGLSATLIII